MKLHSLDSYFRYQKYSESLVNVANSSNNTGRCTVLQITLRTLT